MKALRAHERGGPERLVYEDAPAPAAPQGDDVLVRVRVASLTFDELTWDETWQADGVDRTPIVPSHEFAGVVVAVGPDADGVAEGDEVFGLAPFHRDDGAAAEYVLVPASSVARKPRGVADATAAASVLPALTAMEALDEHLGLERGRACSCAAARAASARSSPGSHTREASASGSRFARRGARARGPLLRRDDEHRPA